MRGVPATYYPTHVWESTSFPRYLSNSLLPAIYRTLFSLTLQVLAHCPSGLLHTVPMTVHRGTQIAHAFVQLYLLLTKLIHLFGLLIETVA